jgi:hypothetical protein
MIDPSEFVEPVESGPGPTTSHTGVWCILSAGICALLTVLTITLRAAALVNFVQRSFGWSQGHLIGQWVFVICSLGTGLLAMVTGIFALRAVDHRNRRLGLLGMIAAGLALCALLVWESLIGFINLFWDI